LGAHVKEEAHGTYGREEKYTGFWLEQLKIQLGRPRHRGQNNTTIDLRVTV
jgi:hypothetical protein